MPTTTLHGPVIAGLPNGYPTYWTVQKYRSTVKRKKPADVIRSPTHYNAWKRNARTEPDFVNGKIATPYYGTVAASDSSAEINKLKASAAVKSDARVLAKIKTEKWNLGVFLAELPETQKYLRTAIPRLVNFYLAMRRRLKDPKYWRSLVRRGKRFLKKRKLRGTHQGSGDLAGAWLEFRYAASPLVYDMQDMLTYFYDSATQMPIFRAASGATDFHASVVKTANGPTTSILCEVLCKTVVYYSAKADANALKRLGLINLPAVLWELAPLSFVVDMVLPIGDFIGNFDAMVGVTVLSSTRSTRTTVIEVRPSFVNRAIGRIYGGSQANQESYSRSVIGAPINKPMFTKSATGKQLCDIVALQRTIVFRP